MYSVVKLADHPVHSVLVMFPITLYSVTLASYVAFTIGGGPFWFRVGFAANVAGVALAVFAATPGFFDWLLGIPGKAAAKGTSARHLALNLLPLALFTADAWVFDGYWSVAPSSVALGIVLAVIGLGFALTASWLGWAPVQEQHVGIVMVPQPTRIDYLEDHRRAA